jgi:glutamate racemase
LKTIKYLERYKPKLIIIASNTLSIQALEEIKKEILSVSIIGFKHPLKEASRLTKKKHIGIMAVEETIRSKELEDQIKKEVPQDILITRFNASPIINLIENGTYIINELINEQKTLEIISNVFGCHDELEKKIDVITLSSAHLPFVKRYLTYLLPTVRFVDPAQIVARDVKKFLGFKRILKKTGRSRVQILVSNDKKQFEEAIHKMGIREPVQEAFFNF